MGMSLGLGKGYQFRVVSSPINLTPPEISGVFEVGETVSTTNGTWADGYGSFEYEWLRDGAVIDGAASSTYTLVLADDGTLIQSRVYAVKGASTVSKDSSARRVGDDWILATGLWDDNGVWNDSSTWID